MLLFVLFLVNYLPVSKYKCNLSREFNSSTAVEVLVVLDGGCNCLTLCVRELVGARIFLNGHLVSKTSSREKERKNDRCFRMCSPSLPFFAHAREQVSCPKLPNELLVLVWRRWWRHRCVVNKHFSLIPQRLTRFKNRNHKTAWWNRHLLY